MEEIDKTSEFVVKSIVPKRLRARNENIDPNSGSGSGHTKLSDELESKIFNQNVIK